MKLQVTGLRLTALVAALSAQAAFAGGTSQPTTVLYGGGATLPAIAYIGDAWLGSIPAQRLSNTLPPQPGTPSNPLFAGKGSLFLAYALSTADATHKDGTVGVQYCQTGSGTGRKVVTDVTDGTGACGDYSGTPAGFSADTRHADFGASDAPLSNGDLTNFNTTNGSNNYATSFTEIVEEPVLAGSIAIIYNNSDVDPKVQMNFTQSDICNIFSGGVTTWGQIAGHTPKLKTALANPSKAIKVVYRSDGSGTTFSFTNYLSSVCGSLTAANDVAVTGFRTTDTFAGVASNTTGSQAAFGAAPYPVTPAGSIGASGNGGVVTKVADSSVCDGCIGYAEVADAVARQKFASGGAIKFASVSYAADQPKTSSPAPVAPGGTFVCPVGATPASVTNTKTKAATLKCPAVVYNKLDPAKNFLAKGATAVSVTTVGDQVLSGIDANGRPNVVARSDSPSVAGCVELVPPNAYAHPAAAATTKALLDYDRYPITAVTYLMSYESGNTKKVALQGLLSAPYSSSVLAATKTVGKKTGFAPLSVTLGTGAPTGVTDMAHFVTTCIN